MTDEEALATARYILKYNARAAVYSDDVIALCAWVEGASKRLPKPRKPKPEKTQRFRV